MERGREIRLLGRSRKGVYERYHSVHSNFAHLKLPTEGNSNGTSAWVNYIPIYNVTRRGLACVAYP